MKAILERILCVILLLAERGLALRESSHTLGDCSNGNFFGFIELLSMITFYMKMNLSDRIQNEFIKICASSIDAEIASKRAFFYIGKI